MSLSRSIHQTTESVRLASHLFAGVAAALMATTHSGAAVVMIDLTNVNGYDITGTNGGVGSGQTVSIPDWLGAGTGSLDIRNGQSGMEWGLGGSAGATSLELATSSLLLAPASPLNLAQGSTIDSSTPNAIYIPNRVYTLFKSGPAVSASFGTGSFMGFRFGSGTNWNYGSLEVTWDSTNNTFQILSGAYESTANTAILAGATAAVPVPAASLLALMALGGNSFRRNRARAA